MSIFDTNQLVDNLLRLVRSPQVQAFGRQIPGIAQNQGPQPFRMPIGSASSPTPNNSYSAGASPRTPDLGQDPTGGQAQDPIAALYAQLIQQLQQPVAMPTGVDTTNLMQQVHQAIDPIYDQRASSAQHTTDVGTKQVKGMYQALSNDYEQLAPQQAAQAKEAQKQVEDLYGQLKTNIKGDYSRVSKEQGDLFKSLGIESALPDVLDKQDNSVTDALTAASENQTQQSQRYMDQGNIDQTYYREGAPQAIMTGNELSAGMLDKLQQQLAQIEAERTSGIQSTYATELGQAQTSLGQQQQNAQSETARRQGMLWDMLQSQMGGKTQQALTPDTFMSQLPQGIQQQVAGAFTQLQRSPEAVYGKVEDPRNPVPGSFVQTTPQWYLAQADKMLQAGQIDPTTYQALQMYLQLYFKTGQ